MSFLCSCSLGHFIWGPSQTCFLGGPICSLHLWPSGSSAGSKQFRQKKNDCLYPAILTIQSQLPMYLPLRSYYFIVWGTFRDFYQGFACYRLCKRNAKDFYKAASLRAPARVLLWVVSFTGVCSVNMLSVRPASALNISEGLRRPVALLLL